jgi:hypothetical protein
MVEGLPPRATRFNHEITAASMAKRAGRYDFRPFGLASSVMVNAALRLLTPVAAAFGFLRPDIAAGRIDDFWRAHQRDLNFSHAKAP